MDKALKYIAQFGTAFCLMALVWSCAKIPGLQEEKNGEYIRIPFVRVLLEENKAEFTVTAEESFAIECLKEGTQSIFYSAQPIKIINQGNFVKVMNHKGNIIAEHLDEANILPRGNNNKLIVLDKKFRGIMKFLPQGGNVQLINIIYMEDYLRGVVPPELGKRKESEIEAVKAQAVAARTYAMAHLKQYSNQPYDMKSSIIDQVYGGASVELKIVNRAIDETAGQVLYYQDDYVNAYYHSTCGGMTDNIEQVWERKESPYLKAAKDDDACSWSKYFRWKEHFTEQQIRNRIEQYLSSDRGKDLRIAKIKDIKIVGRTPGGRVSVMKVTTENDIFKFKKDRIRWVLGRTSNPDLILPSDNFDVHITKAQDGYIDAVTFSGKGYGHGVGMCQCGAIGLSRQGWNFIDILKRYYTDVEIKKLY